MRFIDICIELHTVSKYNLLTGEEVFLFPNNERRSIMAQYKTVQLTGNEQAIRLSGQNCDIRNDGIDTVYASGRSPVTAGGDGVLSVPAGQSAKLLDANGTVYLMGTGSVSLCGNDYPDAVFKCAPAGGGSGGTVDTEARSAVSALTATVSANKAEAEEHFADAAVHLTQQDAVNAAATVASNPNHLINPDFRINQRGKTEYTAIGYTLDRWQKPYADTTLTVSQEGIRITTNKDLTANTTALRQIFAEDIQAWRGKTITFSVYVTETHERAAMAIVCSTASQSLGPKSVLKQGVNSITLTVPDEPITLLDARFIVNSGSAAGDAFAVSWAKLEAGSRVTAFVPTDPATELGKCQRYYQIRTTGDVAPADLRPSMRATPSVSQLEDGTYAYSAES